MNRKQYLFIIGYSLFIAVLFLFYYGYDFNTGDQAEYLPLVYKKLNPQLYLNDYFVPQAASQITVRYFYVQLIYLLSYIAPVNTICFLLTIASIALTSYSISRITFLFSKNLLASLIAPLFIIIDITTIITAHFYPPFAEWKFTIGGNSIQYNLLLCSSLAKALGSFGLFAFFNKKYNLSALVIGIASLFQLLVGLQLFLIMIIVFVIINIGKRSKQSIIQIIKFALIYVLVSGIIIIPILYNQFLGNANYDKELFYYILYIYRNQQHYLPALFPVGDYLKTGFLVVISLFAYLRIKDENKTALITIIGILISGYIIYTLLLMDTHFYFIGKLQWFKTTIWLSALGFILISIKISQCTKRLIIPFKTSYLFTSLTIIMLLIMFNSNKLHYKEGHFKIGNYKKDDLTKMHEWISVNTPITAIFITFPNDYGFSCEAKRSLIIGYRAIIHNPEFLIPWYSKFDTIYNIHDNNKKRTSQVLQIAIQNYNRNKDVIYKTDFQLIKKTNDSVVLNNIVHQEGDILLIRTL